MDTDDAQSENQVDSKNGSSRPARGPSWNVLWGAENNWARHGQATHHAATHVHSMPMLASGACLDGGRALEQCARQWNSGGGAYLALFVAGLDTQQRELLSFGALRCGGY